MESRVKPCVVHLVRLSEKMINKASTKSGQRHPAPKKRFKCPVCPQTCPTPHELEKHIRRHTNERPFGCGLCNKKFKTQCEVKKHLEIHSDQRPYSCGFCDKGFKTNDSLISHLRTHTKEQPQFCEKCPDIFSFREGLIHHKNIKHDFGKEKQCVVCAKIFYWPSGLLKHLRVHTGEKPFSCLVCGRLFASKSNRDVHSLIHSGCKPFSCKKCPKQFRRNCDLTMHIRRSHSSIRPYKYEICENTDSTKPSRDKHTITHLTEKHHRCETCGKRYGSRTGLRYHQKAHHDKH